MPTNKPDCYQCIHRRPVPGDAHSQCAHPSLEVPALAALGTISELSDQLRDKLMPGYIRAVGNLHGIQKGWFYWPLNYDPAWLESCTGFEPL